MILLWGKRNINKMKNWKHRRELQKHYERREKKKKRRQGNVTKKIRMKIIKKGKELKRLRKSGVVEEEMIVTWGSWVLLLQQLLSRKAASWKVHIKYHSILTFIILYQKKITKFVSFIYFIFHLGFGFQLSPNSVIRIFVLRNSIS